MFLLFSGACCVVAASCPPHAWFWPRHKRDASIKNQKRGGAVRLARGRQLRPCRKRGKISAPLAAEGINFGHDTDS